MAPPRVTVGKTGKERASMDARNALKRKLREKKRLVGSTPDSLRENLVSKLTSSAILKVLRMARARTARREYVATHKSEVASAAKRRNEKNRLICKSAPAATNSRGIFKAVVNVTAAAISHSVAMSNQRRRAVGWAKNNRKKINSRKCKRRRNDAHFLAVGRLRCRLANFLRETKCTKRAPTCDLFGCTVKELTTHLTKRLPAGVELKDRHIDHIFPMSKYSLDTLEDQKRCMHWSNMQTLTPADNLTKKNALPNKCLAKLVRRDCWPLGIEEDDLPD